MWFSTALKHNTGLRWLDFGQNQITDKGAAMLAKALTQQKTLTRLDLDGNNISATTLAAAEAALSEYSPNEADPPPPPPPPPTAAAAMRGQLCQQGCGLIRRCAPSAASAAAASAAASTNEGHGQKGRQKGRGLSTSCGRA